MGGEFQIHTPNNAIWRANDVAGLFSQWSESGAELRPRHHRRSDAVLPLAATPATLVNALDLTLTHGTMPSAMKSIVVSAVSAERRRPLQVVEHAVYLILTSSYYNVWH